VPIEDIILLTKALPNSLNLSPNDLFMGRF